MKHIESFESFLDEEVNLNKTRIETLEAKVATIETFIRKSNWLPNIRAIRPQGSWAHRTIIKPANEKSFDADIVVYIDPINGWDANKYILELRAIFLGSDLYKDKTTLRTRCIRIEYAGDFHLDIVPCIVARQNSQSLEVCNRNDNQFEATNPDAYNLWWQARCNWVGKDQLRKVTRFLKYLRDRRATFNCKSILLTTLIGNQITEIDQYNQATLFCDVPTALKTIVGRLDDYLQANQVMPVVVNPVMQSEDFVRHWDQEKYINFRKMINTYRIWIDEAFNEPDLNKSVTKWRRIFGEFGLDLLGEQATAVKSLLVGKESANRFQDAVAAVTALGPGILSRLTGGFSWVQPLKWREAPIDKKIRVTVRAALYDKKNGTLLKPLTNGEAVPKNRHILFEAINTIGQLFPASDYKVHWQIVNTDADAFRKRQLRGGFDKSDSASKKWEHTAYRGVHWVQAVVVRDRICIGQSEKFYVVVE